LVDHAVGLHEVGKDFGQCCLMLFLEFHALTTFKFGLQPCNLFAVFSEIVFLPRFLLRKSIKNLKTIR